MNRKTFAAGAVAGIILFVISFLFVIGAGQLSSFFRPHSFRWFLEKIVFDIIVGILMALVYHFIQHAIPGKRWSRGFTYGFFVFLLADIPLAFFLTVSFILPLGFLTLFLVGGFFSRILMGFAISLIMRDDQKLNDKKPSRQRDSSHSDS